MENSKKFKFFGCFDLLTSIFQIFVTCANIVISLSLPINNGKLDGSHHTSNFLPAVILAVAVVVIYFNFCQMITGRALMKVGYNVTIKDINNRYSHFILVLKPTYTSQCKELKFTMAGPLIY